MATFRKVIVTSGPTREWIDPVRYISNASSGKMGFHIAEEFVKKGNFEVIYIHGNTLEKFANVPNANNISVETTIQLRDAVLKELTGDSLLVMAAAPADFRPIMTAKHKIKKEDQSGEKQGLLLELEENPDVLVQVSEHIKSNNIENVIRVGFAAETQDLDKNAISKIIKKNLNLIVGNFVGNGKGFGEIDSSVNIYALSGLIKSIGPLSKEDIAKQLVEYLLAF
ncbi:MAG: phosphopantothenoylcysteine decarboxylase [Leptospira sp.]|nr:phosphopantothenoylcysteine decarboxylase [Leptospira sp.]